MELTSQWGPYNSGTARHPLMESEDVSRMKSPFPAPFAAPGAPPQAQSYSPPQYGNQPYGNQQPYGMPPYGANKMGKQVTLKSSSSPYAGKEAFDPAKNILAEPQGMKPQLSAEDRVSQKGSAKVQGTPSLRPGNQNALEESAAFVEAKKIAFKRSLIREDEIGKTGPHFQKNVWEFYRVTAHWSDGLCAGFVHMKQFWPCCCPYLWPVRLCRTIERAAPMRARLCCCGSTYIRSCCALPITLWIFASPILFCVGIYFFNEHRDELKKLNPYVEEGIEWLEGDQQTAIIILVSGITLSLLISGFLWARVLLGVAVRYQIISAMDEPGSFLRKTIVCLCPMNVRVGLHVDRAQGFEPARRQDKSLIDLSDRVATQPVQQEMA